MVFAKKISVCGDIFEDKLNNFKNIITGKLEFTETHIKASGVQAKDKPTVVDDNRMVLRDRNTLKPSNRYNVQSFSLTGQNMDI